jgi:CHAT domain-containing protein
MLGDDEPSLSAAIAMLRGDLASDVGAADDASLAYARADSLFDLAGDALGRAAARQGAGMLLLRGDDPAGAARALRAAAQVQRDAGELRAAALTDVLIGVADGERGSAAAARVGLRRARTILRRMGDAIGEAAALNALGDIEQRAGRTIEAERQYRAGLRALGTRAAPAVATSLHWSLGRALRARHALAGSARELRLAVAAMEGMAGRLPPGDRRTSLLGSASDLYADLALVQHAQGRDGAAFETSEWLRARQMREGMAERDGPRSDLSPVTPAAVSASLAPGEALLEYLVADSATLLFVVTRDTVRAVTLPAGRDALRAAVEFARAAIARGPARSVREPWAPAMRRLRRLLIEPAESTGLLRDASRLLVAPHAELQYLPFAALMRAGSVRYLVEQYEIAYVPSAAIWLALQQRTPPPGTSVLAMAPFPASLPGSGDEARAIGARYGPRAVTLTGAAATQQAFERALPGRSIVHLATYGVLNRRNPAYSFVAFAPSANDDGRLTVSEVLRLSFRARLVVLSACETALGSGPAADVPAGDDWVGLVRAFLLAGADDVMASLWPVEDRPTSRIVRLVYSGLERGDAAAALAAAQRVALRDRATSAPRHWAALVVVGAARGKS